MCVVVVYIRKVKKSESKSQLDIANKTADTGLCISVKLKNLKANHNNLDIRVQSANGCVYP